MAKSSSKAAVNREKCMVDGSEREQERELAILFLSQYITHLFFFLTFVPWRLFVESRFARP